MDSHALAQLDSQLNRLVAHCQQLEQENRALRARDSEWRNERMQLLRQRDAMRSKVEAMISRLKAMEQA
ncbi:TIGR02449 family protein [Motiliproteus sediminis]|uniref:TIGR02449 family protein n=1 Tax=Motiliproteus sediminis TaxID=1468178 RepID=UPI001AEFAA06|nr:TIGR02449 family protein [Motiliproteus sediminis]